MRTTGVNRLQGSVSRLALAAVLAMGTSAGLTGAQAQAQSSPNVAQSSRSYDFNIPAKPLLNALADFTAATGIQVVHSSAEALSGVAPPVSGRLTGDQALRQMLAGSGLDFRFTNANTVTLTRLDGAMLPTVTVEARAANPNSMMGNPPPDYAGGQVARGSQLGLLGNRDFMDTPFSQTSYTAKKIQDQQTKSIKDALLDNPSVQDRQSQTGVSGDNIFIRGFEVGSAAVSYGGLYGILPTYSTMAELAERVELLAGPSAMLNGIQPNGGVGGTVNVVPKRASDEPLYQVTPSYTSSGNFGTHVDVGERFGRDKQFGVRLNGVYRDGETAVEKTSDERGLALAGLDFRGERIRLSADLAYQHQNQEGTVPFVSLAANVPLPSAPDGKLNYGQSWNYRETSDQFGVVRGEIDLSESVTAYAAFGAHDFRRSNYSGGANATITNVNGNATLTPNRNEEYRVSDSGEVGLRSRFGTGAVRHDLALAASYYEEEIGFAQITGSAYATNIYNPVYIAPQNIVTPAAKKSSTIDRTSLAVADTLSILDERVQLTLGARQQQVGSANFNPAGVQTSSGDKSTLSPSAGLVVKPVENISLYGNYIQGLQEGEVVASSFANAGTVFAPYETTQYETGVKVDWGKLATTLSVFQLTKQSVVTDLTTNTRVLEGEQRNRGVELNVFGEAAEGLRVLGGVMFIDPVLTKTQSGLTNGMEAPNTPDFQFRLGGDWDAPFMRGLTFNGRVFYTSSQYIDTALPRRSVPDWTRFDLGASYTFDNTFTPTGQPIVVRFNIENLLDENYWMAPGWRGMPRTFMLSTSFDF